MLTKPDAMHITHHLDLYMNALAARVAARDAAWIHAYTARKVAFTQH